MLESQLSEKIIPADKADEGEGKKGVETGLTLLRLGIWTEEMKLKMKLMVQVVDEAKGEFLIDFS